MARLPRSEIEKRLRREHAHVELSHHTVTVGPPTVIAHLEVVEVRVLVGEIVEPTACGRDEHSVIGHE